MKKSGIYWIKNFTSGKIYIGSTNNFTRRWARHKNKLINNKHENLFLQNAWNKYGENNFIFEILEYVLEKNLLNREQFYLDNFIIWHIKDGKKFDYNVNKKADRPNIIFGEKHPKSKLTNIQKIEICEKRLSSWKVKDLTIYYNVGKNTIYKILRKYIKEKDLLKEIEKKDRSEAISGKNNPMFGNHHSEKTKNKMCGENNPMFGKKSFFLGKHHTEEVKQKLSKIKKSVYVGENHPRAIFTQIDVDEIRYKLWPSGIYSYQEIANIYSLRKKCKISKSTVQNIIYNKTWHDQIINLKKDKK